MASTRGRGRTILLWTVLLMGIRSAFAQSASLSALLASIPSCAVSESKLLELSGWIFGSEGPAIHQSGFRALAIIPHSLHFTASRGRASLVEQALTAFGQLPCVLGNLQAASCSLTNVTLLSECMCTNTTVLAGLSECTQQACSFSDQILAVETEDSLCASFPKESRTNEVKIAAIVTLVLAVPVVLARCATRLHTTKKLWTDDWMALIGMICLAALASMELTSAEMGFGLHYWNVPIENASTLLKLFYAAEIFYILVQVFAKVAIILLFLRVFPARWFSIASKMFFAFMFGHGLVFVFVVAFQCGALSIAEDIFLVVLPIPELWKLQITLHQKISLVFLFALASFATVTSMIRLKYLVTFANTYDSTWDNVDIVVWSLIELLCAVFLGSLPSLRPWFVIIPRLVSETWSKRSRKNYGSNNPSSHQGYLVESSRGTNRKGSLPFVEGAGGYHEQKKRQSYPMTPVSAQGPADHVWEELTD